MREERCAEQAENIPSVARCSPWEQDTTRDRSLTLLLLAIRPLMEGDHKLIPCHSNSGFAPEETGTRSRDAAFPLTTVILGGNYLHVHVGM